MVEQPSLGGDAAAPRIVADRATAAGYAMAWDDDREGIARAGLADRARGRAGNSRERAIAQGFPGRDPDDRGPERLAARRTEWAEREMEPVELPGEIGSELAGGVGAWGAGHGRASIGGWRVVDGKDPDRCKAGAIILDQQCADGRRQKGYGGHGAALTLAMDHDVSISSGAGMKVTVDIDCTPEEARRFMGLPDMSSVHEVYLEKMRKTIDEGVTPDMVEKMMGSWMPMGEAGMNMWRTMFDQMSRGGGTK